MFPNYIFKFKLKNTIVIINWDKNNIVTPVTVNHIKI